MGSRRALLVWLGLSGCGNLLGISDLTGPGTDGNTPGDSNLPDGPPECKAQRYVMIVGGNGGLAWFTQIWPVPAVITGFQGTFAYDDPALAKAVATGDPAHVLFARTIDGQPLFDGRGTSPHPTVFLAGANQPHTQMPSDVMNTNGNGVAAAATVIQAPLAPMFGAVSVGTVGPYGTAPGAATIVNVPDAAGLAAVLGPDTTPTGIQISQYLPGTPDGATTALGMSLATIANGFRSNAVATAIVPAFLDDPHGAFDSGTVTVRANALATMLNAFYADLAASTERDCGHDGKPLSLADNTVLTVTGDTPKNPFVRAVWPDGTPQNSNIVYLRSNGFIKPGWFGSINNGSSATNFDPLSGGAAGAAPATTLQNQAAHASMIYAIARGDMTVTQTFTLSEFSGERAK